MTRVLVTLAMVGYAGFAPAAAAPAMYGKPACSTTQATFRTYARNVYRRDNVSRRALWKMARDRKCARSPKAARNMGAFQRSQSRQRRERRLLDAVTPFVGPDGRRWAIPWYIVACESGGRWDAYNPSGAAGPYQIMAMHGRPFPANTTATRLRHHQIARNLYLSQGSRPWVCA